MSLCLEYRALASVKVSSSRLAHFGRSRRLLEAKDFKAVFDNNSLRASSQHLLILALNKTPSAMASPRLGVVVSKKNVRRAVDRNRIKRLIREHFRLRVAPVIGSNLDCIVMARQGLCNLDNQRIIIELDSQFANIARKAENERKKKDAHASGI